MLIGNFYELLYNIAGKSGRERLVNLPLVLHAVERFGDFLYAIE